MKKGVVAGAASAALGAAIAAALTQSAMAQETGASRVLDEITVTARKRDESLQDVPISVTAFTAESIADFDIYDVRDLASIAPNVTLQTTGGAGTGRFNPNLTFRGLQNTFPVPRTQVGAVFLDGNYVLFGVNAINTSDIERVEVLRGPQNAYFGRNTFAGAINFISRTPGDEFAGEVSASATARGSHDLGASVEGPLLPGKLAGRVSVRQRDKAGHYTASDGGKLGEESTQVISASLFATPTEGLSIRLRGSWQEDDDGPGTDINLVPIDIGDTCQGRFINRGQSTTGATGFNVTLPYFCDRVPGISQLGEGIVSTQTSLTSPTLAGLGNPTELFDAFVNNERGLSSFDRAPNLDRLGLKRRIRSVNLQTDYEFANGMNLGFNYGWQDNKQVLAFDGDRTDGDFNYSYVPVFTNTRTYELRLGSAQERSIRWLVGATYFESSLEGNYGGGGSGQWRSRLLSFQPLNTQVQTSQSLNINPFTGNEDATVKAIYGSVDWDVLDNLTVSAELRYQEDSSVSGAQLLPQFPAIPEEEVWKDTMPRLIGTYKITEDWNLYASWSRGVLPGANNIGFTNQTPFRQGLIRQIIPNVQDVLDSDQLDSYEIGSKQTLLDGRLRYSLALYKMRWSNAKTSTALILPATAETDPTPFTVAGVTTAGTADVWGAELEFTALVTDNWDFGGGLAIQKSELREWGEAGLLRSLAGGQSAGADPNDVSVGATQWRGNEFPRQPRATGNLNTTYRGVVNADWNWFLRGDMTYTGRAWDSTANIVKSDDFYRVNARLGLERNDLTIELFVTNLFDDNTWNYMSRTIVYNTAGQSFLATQPLGNLNVDIGMAVQAPDKREVGLRMRYAF